MAALVVLGLFAGVSCSRSGDSSEEATEDSPSDEGDGGSGGGSGSGLDAGEYGDLGTVCQDGDASGETDVGVTDDEIHVGTVTDRGAEILGGLTKEMYDTAVAFAEWCNDHGGINGRDLVVADRDARLGEYAQRIGEGCAEDFALVGGGAVFDNTDAGARVDCGLVNVAGYVVNAEARAAELQVQALPNPLQEWPIQAYRRMSELYPDTNKFGIMWVDYAGVTTVHEQVVESVETLGYDVVYDQTYAPTGDTNWRTYVQNMRDAGVQGMELIGEAEPFTALLNAFEAEGWYPEWIVAQPNMLEDRVEEEAAGSGGQNIYLRSAFPTFDMADENQAMADYLDMMEQYGTDDARYPAMLGMQALSSLLLFAQSASECGSDLTRDCVLQTALDVDEWTAGGLHAVTDPGNLHATRCGVLVRFGEDGWVYDEEATDPNEGIYNCSEDNILPLTGDYGVEPPAE
jgi:ABC-type branched-subunit amino acid transport system substrate-binding protein